MVPVVDLSRRGARLAEAFGARAAQLAAGGTYLLGPELAAFEREWADALGARHAVAVASGASAIQLALTAAGIGRGDQVLVPAFTAVPTVSAVIAAGAHPVAVDVDPQTACITEATIDRARTPAVRAVVVVHLYGYPAPVPDPARLGGCVVIEDAAQSSGGGSTPGRRLSTATASSFYPTKNLGGIGDGGAVTTDDPDLADRVRRLRAHGMTEQYVHVDVSQNFRMSDLEAAWLRLGLPLLAADVDARRSIAARYRAAAPQLRWQLGDDRHAYHLCVFRSSERDRTRAALTEAGVGSAVHYPLAVPQQPAYRELLAGTFPEAEGWARECVSVPCFPEMTEHEIDHVATALAALPAGT